MKKILTLILAVISVTAVLAKDYPSTIAIMVNNATLEPTAKNIEVTKQTNGKYTLALRDFSLDLDGEEDIKVGDVVVKDIDAATSEDGTVILHTEQKIRINSMLGLMLGEIPIVLNATISPDDVLEARLDISLAGQEVIVAISSEAYQIPNSDFELFHTETMENNSAEEPNHWHSFMSCTGDLASTVSSVIHTFPETEILRPNTTGTKCVKLVSGKVMSIAVANGTITTGRLKAGSMTATSSENCAFLDLGNADTDANGDPFYTVMRAMPDSLAVWVKFKQGTPSAKYPYASVNAVITDGSYYQDPQGGDNFVAQAKNATIESKGFAWQRISCPFVYTDKALTPRAILATITTNPEPSKASGSDVLYVDDLALIYNSQLSDIKIDGTSLPGFKPNVYQYTVANLDIDKLTFDGPRGKRIFTYHDTESNVYTIISYAQDLMSSTTYAINYTTATAIRIEEAKPAKATVIGTYNLAGQRVPQNAKGVVITRYSDGSSVKTVR